MARLIAAACPWLQVASYCASPSLRQVPEQINLQVTGASTATVAFVTFGGNHSSIPVAEFGTDPTIDTKTTAIGVTHLYQSPSSDDGPQPERSYSMHFVSMEGLQERTNYYYRVRSSALPPAGPPPAPPAATCAGWVCTVAQQGAVCKKGKPGASDRDNRCC